MLNFESPKMTCDGGNCGGWKTYAMRTVAAHHNILLNSAQFTFFLVALVCLFKE
jgi:hypothetical protein